MTDFSFSFEHLLFWRQLIFWTLNIVGFGSALTAYSSYRFSSKANTLLATIVLAAIVVVLLGFFPIEWGYGTDRVNYGRYFLDIQHGFTQIGFEQREYGFVLFQYIISRFCTVNQYFVLTAFVYILNYTVAIRRMVGGNSYWLLVAVVMSMAFTSYNLNTMRAGLAISFLVLSLSMYPSKIKMGICMFIAIIIHTSMLIPTMMIAVSFYYDRTPLYYKLWLLSIPVSFIAGGFFNSMFAGFSEDDRTQYLTTETSSYNIGFRIDFILYSLAPVLVGGYYIFKKNFRDKFYSVVYNSFLLTNIFWILVIRANYSDRFAYLSWFMIPFVLVYPLLKQKMSIKENVWLSAIIMGESIFRILV